MQTIFAVGVALLAANAGYCADETAEPFDPVRFKRHVEKLCANSHRRAGTPEGIVARDYIESELKGLGYEIYPQHFNVPQFEHSECRMTVNNQDVEIFPLQPNLLQGAVTGPDGLTGNVIYAGSGRAEDFNGVDPRKAIVLLDFSQHEGGYQAFALGASAVVYVEDEGMLPVYARDKQTSLSADLPRFFMRREAAIEAGLLSRGTVKATIKAAGQWKVFEGTNLVVTIPGTGGADSADEAVVLSCHYDSLGTVPALAPAARAAANCAALLETARLFKDAKPARRVVIAFFDARCQYHLGVRNFYFAAHKIRKEAWNVDPLQTVRKKYYADEKKSIADTLESLQKVAADAIPESSAGSRNLEHISADAEIQLDRTASWTADDFVDPITRLNRRLAEQKRLKQDFEATKRRVEELSKIKEKWTRIRRSIKTRILPAEDRETYAETLAKTVARLSRRLAEIEKLETRTDEHIRVGELLLTDKKDAPRRVAGHFVFNLSDACPRWGVVVGGNCPLDQATIAERRVGTYGRAFGGVRAAVSRLRKTGVWNSDAFLDDTISGLHEPRMWIPNPFTHDGEIAEAFGFYGFAFMTIGDGYDREGLPGDTMMALKFENFLPQAVHAAQLARAMADEPEFGGQSAIGLRAQHVLYKREGGSLTGNNVIIFKEGSSVADEPAAGAIVIGQPAKGNNDFSVDDKKIPGFSRYACSVCDGNGYFELPSVITDRWMFDAALFDDRGRVTHINSLSVDGIRNPYSNFHLGPTKLQLFRAHGGSLSLCRDMLTSVPLLEADWRLLNPLNDADYPRHFFRQVEGTVAFYVPYGNGAKLFSKGICSYLNATGAKPMGEGFVWEPADAPADSYGVYPMPGVITAERSARDLLCLNDSRLQVLRSAKLFNSSIERMHGFAEDQVSSMENAAKAGQWGKVSIHGDAAAIAENRNYAPIIETMNDVIKAVIFLLALAVPFAFALERLFIGTPNIYRQILGFAAFFIVTFAILFTIHPAFELAATPLIIFLAFAIVVMSGFVISIVVTRFQHEIKAIQGVAGSVHSADLSRMGTMMAAMQMGISTMRRRPLRTTLTAVTVVLLTFTILCFASFSSSAGVIDSYIGAQFNRPSILTHNKTWSPMSQQAVRFMEGLLKDEADVFSRVWLSSEPALPVSIPVMRIDRKRYTMLSGIVGMPEAEKTATPEAFAALTGDTERMTHGDGVFLSRDIMRELDVSNGDQVIIQGRTFTVAGHFDEGKMDEIRQLDGSPLLPLDYEAVKESSMNTSNARDEDLFKAIFESLDASSLTPVSPSQVGFMSPQNLLEIGGKPRAIVIVPKKPEAAAAISRKIANLTNNYVYSGQPDGVHNYYYATRLSVTGLGELLVPLILGGLIVFSTMLGSVVEREKEIYTFSALGLAPPHVAMLFFAEVCIYAVIGGLGGYLVGQSLVTFLTWLSTTYGIVQVPDVNYSSMTAIFTILLVMATVLVSTIYPAIKASRSANPGVQRTWKIPKPSGDTHNIIFPFTVSAYDMKGIVSFLKEHFDSHGDVSLGTFAAQQAEIYRADDKGNLGLRAKVWLAPFDLGVSQSFEMVSRPSEIEGIQEVNICFVRVSGRPSNWERFNRAFINDLRKQFLIWRALSVETMESYRARTELSLRAMRVEGPVLVESPASAK